MFRKETFQKAGIINIMLVALVGCSTVTATSYQSIPCEPPAGKTIKGVGSHSIEKDCEGLLQCLMTSTTREQDLELMRKSRDNATEDAESKCETHRATYKPEEENKNIEKAALAVILAIGAGAITSGGSSTVTSTTGAVAAAAGCPTCAL